MNEQPTSRPEYALILADMAGGELTAAELDRLVDLSVADHDGDWTSALERVRELGERAWLDMLDAAVGEAE